MAQIDEALELLRMARKRKRITKENVVEEEEVSWGCSDAALSELERHIEDRALPFVKFFNSTVHDSYWNDKELFTPDDAAVLADQLRKIIAVQTGALSVIEEEIARNRAVIAMRFCT